MVTALSPPTDPLFTFRLQLFHHLKVIVDGAFGRCGIFFLRQIHHFRLFFGLLMVLWKGISHAYVEAASLADLLLVRLRLVRLNFTGLRPPCP